MPLLVRVLIWQCLKVLLSPLVLISVLEIIIVIFSNWFSVVMDDRELSQLLGLAVCILWCPEVAKNVPHVMVRAQSRRAWRHCLVLKRTVMLVHISKISAWSC